MDVCDKQTHVQQDRESKKPTVAGHTGHDEIGSANGVSIRVNSPPPETIRKFETDCLNHGQNRNSSVKKLRSRGVQLNQRWKWSKKLDKIRQAICWDKEIDFEKQLEILNLGCLLKSKDELNNVSLCTYAMNYKKNEFFMVLINSLLKNKNPHGITEQRDQNGNTLLHYVCGIGDKPMVELLKKILGGELVDSIVSLENINGKTPMAMACQNGRIAVVDLLDELPEAEKRSLTKSSLVKLLQAACSACTYSDSDSDSDPDYEHQKIQIVSKLLTALKNFPPEEDNGSQVFEAIKAGADTGESSLHHACYRGYSYIVQFLLGKLTEQQAGELIINEKHPLLQIVCKSSYSEKNDIVKHLLDHLDDNQRMQALNAGRENKENPSPLQYACLNGDELLLDILLEGLDSDQKESLLKDQNLLHFAVKCYKPNQDWITKLSDLCRDHFHEIIFSGFESGKSALHVVFDQYRLERDLICLLLDRLDKEKTPCQWFMIPSAKTRYSPFTQVYRKGYLEIVTQLLEKLSKEDAINCIMMLAKETASSSRSSPDERQAKIFKFFLDYLDEEALKKYLLPKQLESNKDNLYLLADKSIIESVYKKLGKKGFAKNMKGVNGKILINKLFISVKLDVIKFLYKHEKEMIEELLIAQEKEGKCTPLHELLMCNEPRYILGKKIEFLELIIENDKEGTILKKGLKIQDKKGRTPMHFLLDTIDSQMVMKIIEHLNEHDLNQILKIQDKNGETPLHGLLKQGNYYNNGDILRLQELESKDIKVHTLTDIVIKIVEKAKEGGNSDFLAIRDVAGRTLLDCAKEHYELYPDDRDDRVIECLK